MGGFVGHSDVQCECPVSIAGTIPGRADSVNIRPPNMLHCRFLKVRLFCLHSVYNCPIQKLSMISIQYSIGKTANLLIDN